MKKTINKLFFIWNYDKEEQWLNKMAARGLALTSVRFCQYEFEDCTPGEYSIRLAFLENAFNDAENENFIEFVEETGAEHITTYRGWAYFRKKTSQDNFEIFSDKSSLISHITKIIWFIRLLSGINLWFGCYNLYLYFQIGSSLNLIGIVSLLIAIFCAIGSCPLIAKRKKLKTEHQIFE